MINKIKNAVQLYPDRIAYIHNGNEITYGTLWQRANEYASLLRRQGSGAVIIYGHKSIDMLVSMVACIISQRTYIPVDIYMPVSRISDIIKLTSAQLLIANESITIDRIESCCPEGLLRFKDRAENCCSSENIYTIFTSGSTGIPKGVPISNENLNNFVDWISSIEPFNAYNGIRVANQASFSFDLSVADIFYSLCNGHTLVGMDSEIQKDFGALYNFFLLNRIELTVTTPTFMKLCLLIKEFNSTNLPFIKCMYFCGEQLEASVVRKLRQRFPDCKIVNAYGPTEATSAVSAALIGDDDIALDDLLPVGDVDTFATQISIEKDEIILSGKSVFGGYLGTEENLDFYSTGDIGYIKNGKLYCKGRKDSQIKFKGYRIELYDVENNLKSLNGVFDAAVIAKYSASGNVNKIAAYIVCEESLTVAGIKEALRQRLPDYMIPSQITILDSLPLNENKKIDRRKLALL